MMSLYSELPEDILAKIAKDYLPSFSHLIPFSGVCKWWRAVALQQLQLNNYRFPCLPGFLESRTFAPDSHRFNPLPDFLAAAGGKSPPPPPRPYTRSRRRLPRHVTIPLGFETRTRPSDNPCVASKDGWVLVIQPETGPGPVKPYLLNPITGAFFTLPPLFRPALEDILKAVISSSPDHDDCHVILVFTSSSNRVQLAWCKLRKEGRRQEYWAFLNLDFIPGKSRFQDASCFQGKLYLLDDHNLHVFDDLGDRRRSRVLSMPFGENCRWLRFFLFHLNDGQLHVITYYRLSAEPFKVHKLLPPADNNNNGEDDRWEKVRSLGGNAVVLSQSHPSICLPASDHNGVKDSRIYFHHIQDCRRGYNEPTRFSSGVFNLSDHRLEIFDEQEQRNCFAFLPMPWNISKHRKANDRKDDGGSAPLLAEEALLKKKKKKNNRQQHDTDDANVVFRYGSNKFQVLFSMADDDECGYYNDDDDDWEDQGGDGAMEALRQQLIDSLRITV